MLVPDTFSCCSHKDFYSLNAKVCLKRYLFSFLPFFLVHIYNYLRTITTIFMGNNTAISNNVLLGSVVFKLIAMMTGVLGNVTVILCTIFLNKEKTAISYLVGNLALADLLVCLTFYPTWIIEFIQTMLSFDSDQKLFCKFSRSTMWAFMFDSTATLLALITVDRYLYIVKPLRYLQTVTLRRVFLAVSGIWFVSCCILTVQYIYISKSLRRICLLQLI